MRDPARIPRILEALRVEWEKQPDMRLGQLLVNSLSASWRSNPATSSLEGPDELWGLLCLMEDQPLVAHVQSFCRPKKTGQ